MRSVLVVAVLMVSACGTSSTAAHVSPPASATLATSAPATASPVAGASPSPSAATSPAASPAGAASLVHCTATAPASDNLVIGSITGSSAVVVRDIQDTSHPFNLCTLDPGAMSPQFAAGPRVAYASAAGQIVVADLSGGGATVMASPGPTFGPGHYAISPDGHSVTYVLGSDWHLANASGDRVLTTLPPVPGRGVNPDEDDFFLGSSPDGLYIALVQTFATGGTGETAPDQVRKASDGTLVFSTSGMTMGVWASVPSRLFFRDGSGSMQRWDPSSGVSPMMALHWIRPQASPNGRWIAYTFRTSTGVGGVGFYSVQGNSVANTSPPGRSGVRFLNNVLAWYIGEKPCDTCFGGLPTPTGVTYIYDIGGAAEVASRLTSVLDSWPHTTAPGI